MYFEKIGEVGNGFGGNCDVYECDEINALPNAVPFSRAFIYSDEGIDVAMHSSKGFWIDTKGNKKFDTFIPEVISDLGTVTFTKDGEEVEELTYGDTVTVTVTADSGYQVKTITLNGEEIENGAEITVDGDILLIAEFEEAPEPERKTYTYYGVYSEGDIVIYTGEETGEPTQWLHKVSDDKYPNGEEWLGAEFTLVMGGEPYTSTITEEIYDDAIVQHEGYVSINDSLVYSGEGVIDEDGHEINGTYFVSVNGNQTYYVSKLEIGGEAPEPSV